MSQQSRLKIYLQYRGELLNYASAVLSTRERAEDVVQEAWLKFEHQPLDDVQQPVGYLFRIIRNLALDELRSQKRDEYHATSLDNLNEVPISPADPAAEASRRIELERLQIALAELDEECRLAFELHRFSGLTLKQIAHHMGISQSSAHRHVQQAMLHCLKALHGSPKHA